MTAAPETTPTTKSPSPTEKEIAADVIAWLKRQGYDISEEKGVLLPHRGHACTPDILAVNESIIAVVEVKKSLNVDVLNQARRWKGFAHKIAVAVAHPGHYPSREHKARVALCRGERIGVIYRQRNGTVEVHVEAPCWRKMEVDIGPISEARTIGRTLVQEAGTPSPMGRSSGRLSDALQPVREQLAILPWQRAKFIGGALNWSKKQINDFLNRARRGELEQHGIIHRNNGGVMEFANEDAEQSP